MNINTMVYRLSHKWDNLKVWVHDLIYPWNCVKIQTLPRHWSEKDTVLLHANFQILTDFIENELMKQKNILQDVEKEVKWMQDGDYEPTEIQKVVEQINKDNSIMLTLMKLYKWWKTERAIRDSKYPDYPVTCERSLEMINSDNKEFIVWATDYKKYEDMCDQEDTDKLIELIKLRAYMWT